MTRLSAVALALALALVSGCRDQGPISPLRPNPAASDLSDGSSGGNPNFFFLPPMVKSSAANGTVNLALRPVVKLCRIVPDGTGIPDCTDDNVVATAAMGSGSNGLSGISLGSDLYQANWDTKGTAGVGPGDVVRVSIYTRPAQAGESVTDVPRLGYADVVLESTGSAKRRSVNGTLDEGGYYITLVDGRTLPIKFRVEQGAVSYAVATQDGTDPADIPPCNDCVEQTINTSTGSVTVTTPSAEAGVFFPQGAIPAAVNGGQVTVTINRINPYAQPNGRCLPTAVPQAEGCYHYATDPALPGGFTTDVTVGFCDDASAPDDTYEMFKYSELHPGDGVVPMDGEGPVGFLDCSGFALSMPPVAAGPARALLRLAASGWNRVARPLSRVLGPGVLYAKDQGLGGLTGSFSTFGYAASLQASKTSGDGQTGTINTLLTTQPTVHVVSSHHGAAVPNVPVIFSVAEGAVTAGGAVADTVDTDANGDASVPWTLGGTAGTQTLTARVPGLNAEDTLTFTATGTTAVTLGSGTDPSGDGLLLPSSQVPVPDFVSTSAVVSGADLVIQVDFTPGTYRDSTETQILLDTDLNTATGYPGVDAANSDSSVMGSDYMIDVGSVALGGGAAVVSQGVTGGFTSPVTLGTGAVSLLPGQSGFTLTVPLSAIGGGAAMNVKMITYTDLSPSSTTGIQDRLTDLGSLPVYFGPTIF